MMVGTYVITEFYLPKLAALLSITGSSLIIGEVYQDQDVTAAIGRKLPAVSQILLSMSFGDLLFSLGWFLGTWVVPQDLHGNFLHGTNHGTAGTCAFQGFIVQMGYIASLLFNASLAVVYLLQTRYQWRSERLLAGNKLLVTIVVLWTVCLVSAMIPLCLDMYHGVGPVCWVSAPAAPNCAVIDGMETIECQQGRDTTALLFSLQVIPIWLCIILDSVIMVLIYCTARSLEREAQQSHDKRQRHGQINDDSITGHGAGTASSVLSERILEDPGIVDEEQTPPQQPDEQHASSNHTPPRDIGIEGESTIAVSRTSTKQSTRSSLSKKRSRIVAKQGVWYIAGFFLTYGLATIAVLVLVTTGDWNPPLDRASYFFLALQGLWNFLIFSRGRKTMKTRIGAAVKRWIWDTPWCCCWRRPCRFMHRFLFPSSSPTHLDGGVPPPQHGDQNLVKSHAYKHEHHFHNSRMAQHHFNDDKSSVNNLTLAPIDEDKVTQLYDQSMVTIEEGQHSKHNCSGFWIGAKETLVSDLGASEISRGSSDDECSSSSSDSSNDDEQSMGKPPFKPTRATSDRDVLNSAPPSKPLRRASKNAVKMKECGPNSKPVRLVSEVSICERKEMDKSPTRPIRLVSEMSELSVFDDDRHPKDDIVPSQPIRFESEVSNGAEHDDCPARPSGL